MQLLLQVLASGVLLGGLYALMALGLALVWGVLNIVNLSHGALIMLGAYATYFLFTGAHIDPFAALPITAIVSVRRRLCHPARHPQPRHPRADVQHAADHVRHRGDPHVPGATVVFGGLPRDQSGLRGIELCRRRDHDSARAGDLVRDRDRPHGGDVAVPAAHPHRPRHSRCRAESRRGTTLRRRSEEHLRGNVRARRGARRRCRRAVRHGLADQSVHWRTAHRQVVCDRDHRRP